MKTSERQPSSQWHYLKNTAGYWEKKRIILNAVLLADIIAWIVITWPDFRPVLKIDSLLFLLIIGIIANICFSLVYLIELVLQRSPIWQWYRHLRMGLWVFGLLISIILLNYWIFDNIYPYLPL